MESDIDLRRILFLDIETVPEQSNFDELEEDWQTLWLKKAKILSKYHSEEVEDNLYQRAGIYAEFGKIVCISAGFFYKNNNELHFRIRSFSNENEKDLLSEFAQMLNTHFFKRYHYLCAHNGQEFDFPYICRRTLINGLELPKGLRIMGNKPWENKHLLDTMKLWAFGDVKSFTSLEVMARSFGIPTPKDDISGADVYRVYYLEKDLKRIVAYCQKDVATLANLFCSLIGQPHIETDKIEISQ
ncbi:MAG: ribonuclease H-like domain-containing protein [Bacteroidia bacterium]